MRTAFCSLLLLASCSAAAESIEDLLGAGRLTEAEQTIDETLLANPDNATATAQKGIVRFLQAVERLAQTNYRYGVGESGRALPFFRLPVPDNPEPDRVTYEDFRSLIQRFIDDLAEAEALLADLGDSPMKWRIDLAAVRLDFNADGQADADESLGKTFTAMVGRPRRDPQPLEFVVGIDTADVYWLRGYCHVMQAIGETVLAYDQQRAFDHTAQILFPNAEVTHGFLKPASKTNRANRMVATVLDAVALVHLADWPLAEAERLKAAHSHLLKMVETSRASWAAIQSEDDDDHEWIPGPNQKSVMPRGSISQRQIDAWLEFLTEAEALLNGEKLAPFWRNDPRGLNIKRVFYEPKRFDLILWVQGSAAAPYLEEGDQTKPETWRQLQRVFRGNFLGFAVWIN